MKLSVLDLVPVRSDQTSVDAVAASVALAQLADRLGFERYWFAEHHNMPAVASTAPPVLIAAVAAKTERIRVGSGGVMLPNHAPLTVAEQFATLEAIAPGRIDLGLGRAPGSDPVVTALLRSSGPTSDVDRFEDNIRDIRMLAGDAATITIRTNDGLREYEVRATPAAIAAPQVWILGSSEYSAHLAAKLGVPYVFAHHFAGVGTAQALDIYRREFTPSGEPGDLDAPRTFLTVNAVVAETAEEAQARALPALHNMARLRSGLPLRALDTVEAAQAEQLAPAAQHIVDEMSARWVVDAPAAAGRRIQELATEFGVDEVMLSPGAGSREGEALDRAIGREQTLELLADELLG